MSTYIENYQRVTNDKGKPAGTQWVFYCPFPGCVGYRKRKLFVCPRLGGWSCKHCQQEVPGKQYREDCAEPHGGSWREFAQMMGDDLSLWPTNPCYEDSQKVELLSSKKRRQLWTYMFAEAPLLPEHAAIAWKRGIDPERAGYKSAVKELLDKLIQQFGEEVVECGGLMYRSSKGVLLPRKCAEPGRLLIPYWDGEDVFYFVGYMACPSIRPGQSFDDYAVLKNNWIKVAGPANYQPSLYGDIPANADYLIVTEGQFKRDAAYQRGFPCIGQQGIGNGQAALVRKICEAGVKHTIILYDTELDDPENVDHAAEKLARDLLKKDRSVFRARLPLDPDISGGRKMDVDSYLAKYSSAEFAQILQEAVPYRFMTDEEEAEANEEESSDDPDTEDA